MTTTIEKPKKGQLYVPLKKQAVHYKSRKVTPVWRVTVLLKEHVFAREVYFQNDAVISFADLRENYAAISPSELYSEEELSILSTSEIKEIKRLFGNEAGSQNPSTFDNLVKAHANLKLPTPHRCSLWQKFFQHLKRGF
jgi:hypothetical protein